ncbi:uncharacterized protein EV420DRAFT_1642076 [Desarmillaria tabescens]|uniref:Uncharacterized protein n=1 Tax=Armillaria tabescens TaxID=1929756 RepID=A0AA39N6H0_ARMTA|nr:uncharacterized protein EV420DRAFT_1642076 [Desarmillaria tabescens]KAK0459080.1 hypothetical protein EV420DRAFT_1642076 [Desarmillaria tabescens]
MSMDNQTKTFTTYETTGNSDQDDHAERPFKVDADWNEEWNAGSPGGYSIMRKECEVEIMSEDYLTTDVALVDSATGDDGREEGFEGG